MIKNDRGITLISLVITIALMLILSSTVINISFNRFEINKANMMVNDLEILADKVSNYYALYGGLPVLREANNNPIQYSGALNFGKNSGDNGVYYILDLNALGELTLNYGKDGYENPNGSDDVYIINEQSHNIYYVKGVEIDNETYHYLNNEFASLVDSVPPTAPEIKVVSGAYYENGGYYTTSVDLEITSGKDNWSGVNYTKYSVNGSEYQFSEESKLVTISQEGTHTIKARTYDNASSSNKSDEVSIKIRIDFPDPVPTPTPPDENVITPPTNTITPPTPDVLTPPTIKFSSYTDIKNGLYYGSGDDIIVRILSNKDSDTNIYETFYSIDNGANYTSFLRTEGSEEKIQSLTHGTYKIRAYNADVQGNRSSEVIETIIIRMAPNKPKIEITSTKNSDGTYSLPVQIKITGGTSRGSGVGETAFRVIGDEETINETFEGEYYTYTITKDGTYTISATTSSYADNESDNFVEWSEWSELSFSTCAHNFVLTYDHAAWRGEYEDYPYCHLKAYACTICDKLDRNTTTWEWHYWGSQSGYTQFNDPRACMGCGYRMLNTWKDYTYPGSGARATPEEAFKNYWNPVVGLTEDYIEQLNATIEDYHFAN